MITIITQIVWAHMVTIKPLAVLAAIFRESKLNDMAADVATKVDNGHILYRYDHFVQL